MPRLIHARPKYRQHRASKQAVVEIAGRTHYLGPYGSTESQAAYDRLVTAWMAAGRPADWRPGNSAPPHPRETPPEPNPPSGERLPKLAPSEPANGECSVLRLIKEFWQFAKRRYVTFGRVTGTHQNYKPVLKLLRRRCGHLKVSEFGPVALEALRNDMIQRGNSRRYINDNIDRIRRVFVWGVSKEIVPPVVPQALEALENLHEGASGVIEHEPITIVSDDVINRTLEFLPQVVADMVRVQLLTGSRPGEICILRPRDVDRSGTLWVYRPAYHKTQHKGKKRQIVIASSGYLASVPRPCPKCLLLLAGRSTVSAQPDTAPPPQNPDDPLASRSSAQTERPATSRQLLHERFVSTGDYPCLRSGLSDSRGLAGGTAAAMARGAPLGS